MTQRGLGAAHGGVVRLVPDYAGTVLWFPHPVAYAHTRLHPDLITDLIRWELGYYDALDAGFNWQSPAHASAFTSDGVALALRLAVQLGAGFDVEFATYEAGVASRRFRSELPADNPSAAAAFTALSARPASSWAPTGWPTRALRNTIGL